jgi:DtxR family Mn-dependent transcriptional regulator
LEPRGRRLPIDYARALYILGARPGAGYARPSRVARLLGVTRATATIMLRRLEARGLAERGPRGSVRLTEAGLSALARHAWKVGLLECLLARGGLPPGVAAAIARKLAPHLSDEEARLICEGLGHPRVCPHGRRIPHPCSGEESPEGSCYFTLQLAERI